MEVLRNVETCTLQQLMLGGAFWLDGVLCMKTKSCSPDASVFSVVDLKDGDIISLKVTTVVIPADVVVVERSLIKDCNGLCDK